MAPPHGTPPPGGVTVVYMGLHGSACSSPGSPWKDFPSGRSWKASMVQKKKKMPETPFLSPLTPECSVKQSQEKGWTTEQIESGGKRLHAE